GPEGQPVMSAERHYIWQVSCCDAAVVSLMDGAGGTGEPVQPDGASDRFGGDRGDRSNGRVRRGTAPCRSRWAGDGRGVAVAPVAGDRTGGSDRDRAAWRVPRPRQGHGAAGAGPVAVWQQPDGGWHR